MKTDIRDAVSHNKFSQSYQYMLHVSVSLSIPTHLNTWFKNQIKCIYILNFQYLKNFTTHNILYVTIEI